MLIAEGRKNIFTVSTSINKLVTPNQEKITEAYWGDPNKKMFLVNITQKSGQHIVNKGVFSDFF